VTVPVVVFTIAGEPASEGLGRPYTVVYDGMCKVCTRLARVLRKWDGGRNLEVVAAQAPGVMPRFPWIPARAYAEALQMIGEDGMTWQGAAAIEKLLDVLPRGRLISWVFSIPFVRGFADRFYRWFARNRYHLGCGDHCQSRPLSVLFEEGEKVEKVVITSPSASSE
jgi:predicted DCC family thiol-disulfide oxidoreductase YuxK